MSELIELFVDMAPPSANRIWLQNYRAGKTYLNPVYRQFCALVGLRVRQKSLRLPEDWKYCAVEIVVHPKTRRGDVDNRIKPTLDALTKSGFWKDDSVVAQVRARFGKPDKKGCVLIKIERRDEKFAN